MEAQEIAVRLGVAVLFGSLIGFERQWLQRMTGLRTNSLVAVGAAGFVVFSMMVSGDKQSDAGRSSGRFGRRLSWSGRDPA
jgi:putative Mg2+ transporter-C (MgtC) family protein